MKTFFSSLRLLGVLTLLTGLLYPLAVWAVGQAFFRDAAEGSQLHREGRLVGSALLAQKTTDPRYFWSRPSAGDYATVASGASNQAWSNAKLAAAIAERRAAHGGAAALPADLLTGSGGGLDPHLSPAAVIAQKDRVAQARHLNAAQRIALNDLVARHIEGGQFTPARVNILRLNLALDTAFPSP
ncbi:K(+)-transporting ATPase subunit C [Oleiharenicola lentus]|uniref:Potassium-transporting ATPase KdpC subunit n=1 Tax=Oleiharenicola lentus TaxID=2508720 RepID=A0A4Q1C9C3_9BACT|nr:K(+)-transporting ATPase subunit C [Oleiharenicola lentus]RXK55585.1 K(+)-transporting ATPase subunit C [Oleiharenicola lentus]